LCLLFHFIEFYITLCDTTFDVFILT
jgi:hypothetical protein